MPNPQDHDTTTKRRAGLHVCICGLQTSTHSQVTKHTWRAWQGVCGQRNKDGEAKSCESCDFLECSFILPLVRTFIEGTSHTPCATWLEPPCFEPAEHSQATAEIALLTLLPTLPCMSCRSTTVDAWLKRATNFTIPVGRVHALQHHE